jgi:hypothetical protein
LKSGLVWSLALTLPLKLVTAGTLSDNGSHWVGGTPSDAGSLAWIGWSPGVSATGCARQGLPTHAGSGAGSLDAESMEW